LGSGGALSWCDPAGARNGVNAKRPCPLTARKRLRGWSTLPTRQLTRVVSDHTMLQEVCPACGMTLRLSRIIPGTDNLSGQYIYNCQPCGVWGDRSYRRQSQWARLSMSGIDAAGRHGGYRAIASAPSARNLADEEVEAHDREGSHPAVDRSIVAWQRHWQRRRQSMTTPEKSLRATIRPNGPGEVEAMSWISSSETLSLPI
jgi:hypothetical protein